MDGESNKPSAATAETIFIAALELPLARRPAYLATACGDNQKLLQRVEALLRADEAPQSFLPEQPGPVAAAAPTAADLLAAQLTEQPGDLIGRYKLLEKLGEGGCGVVYMAEQEEPVRRKVALKVIKLGMDTRSVIARFEAERQALALMDHANIAKVLDAGATDTGRPYFVMELVGGIKITDYCEQNRLTTRQRLDLFIQVCHAIQHAHQKGVIHRDIKPSNVLVATQDGVAVPKVIDFGIAKATQGRLTDDTVFTAFEQFLGTPAYMSPEQAQVGGLDVDTRSDIYSLGVLLYELLTGKTPFDAKELLAAGLEAMRRTILEKEPPTPSTRLKQGLAAQPAGSDNSALRTPHSALDRDLDWIVMKCLEKDRARRYETANGLARDIERHLNNEPVVACPPSNLYRLGKLVHRNRVLCAAAGSVFLALAFGLGLSTWLFFRERAGSREQARLRQQAQTEANKSQQVARFLKDMLAGVGPSKARGRDTTMLREILDETANRIGRDLTNQPEVEIELCGTLGEVYDELGLYPQMEAMARQRLSLARSRFGETNLAVASALGQLGLAVHYNATEDSVKLLRRALAIKRRLLGNEDQEVARSIVALAFVLKIRHEFAEAENLAREALGILRKARGAEGLDVAETLSELGDTLNEAGKQAQAEPLLLQAFMIQTNLLGTEDPRVATTLRRLARVFVRQGKLPEAEATCRQALTLARKVVGQEHRDVAVLLNFLGVVLINAGRSPEAEGPLWESHRMVRKLLGIRHPDVAASSDALVDVLMSEHKYSEIEKLFTEIMPPVGESPPVRRSLLRMRARFFARLGRWTEALADASELVPLPPKSMEVWLWRASLLVQTGDLETYEQHRRACVALFGTSTDPGTLATLAKFSLILPASDPDLETFARLGDAAAAPETGQADSPWIQLTKGLAEYRRGRFGAAAEWARKALSEAGADPLREAQACMVLAMAQQQLKQGAEAQATLAKGLQLADTKLPKVENGDIGDGWNDWIIAHAFMREASGLVQDRGHGEKETK